jgi:hypothetical protein
MKALSLTIHEIWSMLQFLQTGKQTDGQAKNSCLWSLDTGTYFKIFGISISRLVVTAIGCVHLGSSLLLNFHLSNCRGAFCCPGPH